jgi:hypothetical protein
MVREMVRRSVRAEEKKREREVKRKEKNRRKRERWNKNRRARREETEVKKVVGEAAVGEVPIPPAAPKGPIEPAPCSQSELAGMLKRVEELEAGVQRRNDEGFSHGVQTMVERSEKVWEERTKWERFQHNAEMEEVKREVGDLREKLENKMGYRGHDKTEYGRTKYIPNKMDKWYNNRSNNNRYHSNNRYGNNNGNNNNNHRHYKHRPAPRQYNQSAIQGRELVPSGSDLQPSNQSVTGSMGNSVTSLTRRTSHSPIRAPMSVVALARSSDASKTDFRVQERGVTRVTETLTRE